MMTCKRCKRSFPHRKGSYCGGCDNEGRPVGEPERVAIQSNLHFRFYGCDFDVGGDPSSGGDTFHITAKTNDRQHYLHLCGLTRVDLRRLAFACMRAVNSKGEQR